MAPPPSDAPTGEVGWGGPLAPPTDARRVQAVQFSEHGARDAIEYRWGSRPAPGRDEVFVDVTACGGCEFCRDGEESIRVDPARLAEAPANGGRVVTCGATTGGRPATDLNGSVRTRLSVVGSTMATPGEVDDAPSLARAARSNRGSAGCSRRAGRPASTDCRRTGRALGTGS